MIFDLFSLNQLLLILEDTFGSYICFFFTVRFALYKAQGPLEVEGYVRSPFACIGDEDNN